jgi:hypothetical protein
MEGYWQCAYCDSYNCIGDTHCCSCGWRPK